MAKGCESRTSPSQMYPSGRWILLAHFPDKARHSADHRISVKALS